MTAHFDNAKPAFEHPGPEAVKTPLKARLRPVLMLGVPALAVAVWAVYAQLTAPFVSTDNAYARVAKVAVNARVSGQVVNIAVADNQRVRKGQVLFQINPEPFQVAVNRAQAQLAVARLRIEGLKASYRQQQADLQAVKASAHFDQQEFGRKQALVTSEFVSRAAYDRADTDLKVSRQRIASMAQQIASTVAALDGDPDIDVDRHPAVREARAQLDEAQLSLSYATVYAPDDGVVAKVDDLQVGSFVTSGAAAFALLSEQRTWIEANFRETQVTHMQPGQAATIRIDTYPDHVFKAHVVSLSPGAGSDFAVLPAENATGNWVKVVQRVPVRLVLDSVDAARPLYAGISATVTVDTGHGSPWWQPFNPFTLAGNAR